MHKIRCDPSSCLGPVDNRVVDIISKFYFPLDPDFLECMALCHGGVSIVDSITVNDSRYKFARFLTLFDYKSDLPGPLRPHPGHSIHDHVDERVEEGIMHLIDGEHNTSRSLFSYLIPFATTRIDAYFDRGDADLYCFDYRNNVYPPRIVLWKAEKAMTEFFRVDRLPSKDVFNEDGQYENIRWESFLIPIASNFSEFSELLRNEN